MAACAFEAPYRVSIEGAPKACVGTLKIEFVPITALKKSAQNARTHSKKQVEQIVSSIRRFGWTSPIIVDEHGSVIAGHGRLEAAIRLGFKAVPVITVSNLKGAEKRALALADNKIAANAGWDRAILAKELGDLALLLPECDLNIDITGFEPAEIDAIMGDLADPEHDPADEIPSPGQHAVSKAGDLWELGAHRLLCGDALEPASYERLMGSNLAAMTISDPPYNVKIKSVQGRGKIKHREFSQASGEMSRDQFTDFLSGAMSLAAKHSKNGSAAFWFMDWRHMSEISSAGERVYSELLNLVIWAKTNGGQGSLYRSQHELVFVFKNGDAPHINNVELGKFGRNRSNVWSYAGVNTFRAGRLDDLYAHPTVKPVALIADALRDCSRRGDIVLDAFAGSGTLLIAAERVGRRGFGIEIDASYVDGAIRRWQSFTGKDATLQSTGKTFDEIARSRTSRVRIGRP